MSARRPPEPRRIRSGGMGREGPRPMGSPSLVVRHAVRAIAGSLVVLLLILSSAHAAAPRTLIAKVERVSAGDTLTALTSDGTKLRIRLMGIDAPGVPHARNSGQSFGDDAREYLTRLIGGRTVRVVSYGQDGHDRLLAVVFLGPINVNVEMVEQGLAGVSLGAACQAYCRDLRVAALKAKRDRVGMWAPGE